MSLGEAGPEVSQWRCCSTDLPGEEGAGGAAGRCARREYGVERARALGKCCPVAQQTQEGALLLL